MFIYRGTNLSRTNLVPGGWEEWDMPFHQNYVPNVFEILRDLKINTVIVNAGTEGGQPWNLETNPNWAENLDKFLDLCNKNGLKVIWHQIVPEWMFGFHVGEDLNLSKSKVDMLAGNNVLNKNFLIDPRIAFWIIRCEPKNEELPWSISVGNYFKQMGAKVSIAKIWDRSQIPLIKDTSTHLAVNIYPARDPIKEAQDTGASVFDVAYQGFRDALNEAILLGGNIPLGKIFLSEFGLRRGIVTNGVTYNWTEETRGEYYRAAFQICKDTGIGGAFPYMLFDILHIDTALIETWGAVGLDGTYYPYVTNQYKNYYFATPISPWLNFLARIVGPIGLGLYFIGRTSRRG